MKKLKTAGVVLLAVMLGLVAVGFLLPSQWRVERSLVMNAPPEKIYPLVADFKNGWPRWSAFDNEDPGIVYRHSGPELGVGASRSWTSEKMGNGYQTITRADPVKGVEFELGMDNGFKMVGTFAFAPADGGTKVTWTDVGDVGSHVFFRYLGLFMDRMMGGTFERSLAALKGLAEAP